VQRAPTLCGVWGRVLMASLTLACAMRGDRDSNPGPSGHRREDSTACTRPTLHIMIRSFPMHSNKSCKGLLANRSRQMVSQKTPVLEFQLSNDDLSYLQLLKWLVHIKHGGAFESTISLDLLVSFRSKQCHISRIMICDFCCNAHGNMAPTSQI